MAKVTAVTRSMTLSGREDGRDDEDYNDDDDRDDYDDDNDRNERDDYNDEDDRDDQKHISLMVIRFIE